MATERAFGESKFYKFPGVVGEINDINRMVGLLRHLDRAVKIPGRAGATQIAIAYFNSRIKALKEKQHDYEDEKYGRTAGERGLGVHFEFLVLGPVEVKCCEMLASGLG